MSLFKCLIVSSFLFAAHTATARTGFGPTATTIRGGAMVFGQVIARDINPRGFDEPLAKAGLPGLYIPPVGAGLGITIWYHRVGITLDGTFPTAKRMDSTKQKTGSAAAIGVSLSYLINDPMETKLIAFYPFLGIQNVSYTYQSVNVPANRSKSFAGSCPYLDLGLGFDFGEILMGGLKAGYLLPLSPIGWRDNTQPQIVTSGQFINRGFYVSLKFGIGLIPGTH